MSLSIGWITFRHVTLDYVFHSMSLACFLLRAFILISWLDIPLHFVVTYLMLQDMFIDHDHLVFALYTYHGLGTFFFFVGSLIQFSTRRSYVHYRKVKDTFLHPHFFREFRLDHLIIFLLWSSSRRLIQGYCCYRWSIDLMTVLFFTPHSFFWIVDRNSLVTFVAISQ